MNIDDTSGPKMPRVDVDWQGGQGGSALDVQCEGFGNGRGALDAIRKRAAALRALAQKDDE